MYCQIFHGCVKEEGGSRGEMKGALQEDVMSLGKIKYGLHTISFFHIGYSSCLTSLAHKQDLP